MIQHGGRKNPRNNKSKTARERTWLINILPLFLDGQVPQNSFWPSSSHYRLFLFFFSSSPKFLLGALELGPLDLFLQTYRGFYVTIRANIISQLFWQ